MQFFFVFFIWCHDCFVLEITLFCLCVPTVLLFPGCSYMLKVCPRLSLNCPCLSIFCPCMSLIYPHDTPIGSRNAVQYIILTNTTKLPPWQGITIVPIDTPLDFLNSLDFQYVCFGYLMVREIKWPSLKSFLILTLFWFALTSLRCTF